MSENRSLADIWMHFSEKSGAETSAAFPKTRRENVVSRGRSNFSVLVPGAAAEPAYAVVPEQRPMPERARTHGDIILHTPCAALILARNSLSAAVRRSVVLRFVSLAPLISPTAYAVQSCFASTSRRHRRSFLFCGSEPTGSSSGCRSAVALEGARIIAR